MAGELTHTTSKERMVPELMFLFEQMPQLSITDPKMTIALCFSVMFSLLYSATNEEQ